MATVNNINIIESLDGSELQPAASSSLQAASTDHQPDPKIPCVAVSSDYTAIYQHRCAEQLARAQPAVARLMDAEPLVVGERLVSFTVPPSVPDDPNASSSRLRRLRMLENAEANETVAFTAYPYVLELLSVVAGTGDLPSGYNSWLALFTAVYLSLPISITNRLCEDLIWTLGGDRTAFLEVFTLMHGYVLGHATLIDTKDISSEIPNRQYVVVALTALHEYLNSNILEGGFGTAKSHIPYSFYELSVRFLEPREYAQCCDLTCRHEATVSDAWDECFHINIEKFTNGNPRMLHHILTSETLPVVLDEWPGSRVESGAGSVAFVEMLCAYINSKSAWRSDLVTNALEALVNLVTVLPNNFEFANILLSNLVASGIEIKFDATRLLTAAVTHSEESYLAWSNFVKQAEIFTKMHPVEKVEKRQNMIEFQCALLEHDMLHHVEDAQLQEFILRNLDQRITSYIDGAKTSNASESIARIFVRGRVRDIRRLKRLGLSVDNLRHDILLVAHGFIQLLEFAEEHGWFASGGIGYQHECVHNLLLKGAFHAARWLYAKYPDTSARLWSTFCQHSFSPIYTRNCGCKDMRCEHRSRGKRYAKFIRWVLLENRERWKNSVPDYLVVNFIRFGDYHGLHALYTISGVQPRREHAHAALNLAVTNGHDAHIIHAMLLMLRCIRDALRIRREQPTLREFLRTAVDGIDGIGLDWMMRRGFFVTAKQAKKHSAK
jgi:hypothetical protein